MFSTVADMVINGVHEDRFIDFLQRTFLPFIYDGQDLVCDLADGDSVSLLGSVK